MTGYSKSRTRIFYGWFALAGVMLLIFTVSGAFVYSFGVFLPVISEDMGWSRGTVALALSLGILAFGLPSPLFGILVSRFGPRFTLIWGNLAAALAIAGLFAVREAWQFYILYIIIGFGGGLGGYIACATVATNWFVKRRSLALAIFTACGSLGGFVFPPVTTALIGAIDWRMTWVVLGGIVAVVGVGLGGVVLVRNRPQDMGLEPDGMPPGFITSESWTAGAHRAGESRGGAPMKDILKGRTIWLISGFAAANAFAVGTMSAHQVAYLEDIGFLPMVAATTVSLLAAMSVIGGITLGALALRLNVKRLALAGFASQLAAMTVLLTSRELGLIYVYAVFLGLGTGALIATMPTFVGLHYHGEQYAKALGIVLPFQVGTQAVAAFVSGAIFDTAHTYRPAFLLVVVFIILGTVFMSLSRLPKRSYHTSA